MRTSAARKWTRESWLGSCSGSSCTYAWMISFARLHCLACPIFLRNVQPERNAQRPKKCVSLRQMKTLPAVLSTKSVTRTRPFMLTPSDPFQLQSKAHPPSKRFPLGLMIFLPAGQSTGANHTTKITTSTRAQGNRAGTDRKETKHLLPLGVVLNPGAALRTRRAVQVLTTCWSSMRALGEQVRL